MSNDIIDPVFLYLSKQGDEFKLFPVKQAFVTELNIGNNKQGHEG